VKLLYACGLVYAPPGRLQSNPLPRWDRQSHVGLPAQHTGLAARLVIHALFHTDPLPDPHKATWQGVARGVVAEYFSTRKGDWSSRYLNLIKSLLSLKSPLGYCSVSECHMSDSAEYWRNAAEAQRMAENSIDPKHKAAWLHIAEQWLRLLRNPTSAEAPSAEQASWADPKSPH